MDISKYIVPIVMAIVWILVEISKPLMSDQTKKWIPAICAALGILLDVWIQNWTFTPDILLAGLASGWAATGANETIKIKQGGGESNG